MNIIPEYLDVVFAIKLQLSPLNLCALMALALFIAMVWRYYRGRTR